MNNALQTDVRNTAGLPPVLSIVGVMIAIAATTTMDASGLFNFSALALLPLMLLFWYLERLSRPEMGFRWGTPAHYTVALLYPLVVIGLIAIVATFSGAVDLSKTNWQKALLNVLIVTVSTALLAIVTEEGFFRGWLWGSLVRRGIIKSHVLIYTSIAFALWHVSAVTLNTEYRPTPSQVPIFLINAAVIGIVWGTLRWMSGSIIVASCSHGLWNGIAYVFFGFGTKTGALGIRDTAIFGPEIGILGLISNAVFAFLFWQWWRTRCNRT
jgi:membrane protease YdiL (CAAX protease family)